MNNEWRISEFSKLTGVSVRTLHHYDQIGLLKASKEANGFRIYGEKDLKILLKILSLKFLGFELLAIKGILDKTIPIKERLLNQKNLLDKKIETLTHARDILHELSETPGEAPSELILKLIEVYRVFHYLQKLRVRKIIDPAISNKVHELSKQSESLLKQMNTLEHNTLVTSCKVLLDDIYLLVPSAIRLHEDKNIT